MEKSEGGNRPYAGYLPSILQVHPVFPARDAEKRARQRRLQMKEQEEDSRASSGGNDKPPAPKHDSPSVKPARSDKLELNRPPSGGSTMTHPLHASIISKDPMYRYHRRQRRKLQRATAETESTTGSRMGMFLPRVKQDKVVHTYQPKFLSHSFAGSTSTTSFPKINENGATGVSTTTFPAINTLVKPKNKASPTKNMFGRYQLPTLSRREY